MLRNWKALFCNKEQTVIIVVNLHILTGAYTSAMLDLLCLFWIETARTQRTAQLIEMLRQPEHHRSSCLWLRMCVRARLLSERSRPVSARADEISQLAHPLFYLPLE